MALSARKKTMGLVLAISGLLLLLLLADSIYYKNRLHAGVWLKELDLGGATAKEVKNILRNAAITFTGPGGKTFTLPLAEAGIIPDGEKIFSEAYSLTRQDYGFNFYARRFQAAVKKTQAPLLYRLDRSLLHKAIIKLEAHFNSEPQDACFKVTGNAHIEISPDKAGLRLNREEFVSCLEMMLREAQSQFVIALPLETLPPQVLTSSLEQKKIKELMSSFTTTFDEANENRTYNMQLASSHLNYLILEPGCVLSLNALLKDSTPQRGYRQAPIIVGGELVPGYGGGLCQVSTTLYNAALLAGLEVVERHNHQLAVPYIPPGRDATLSYGTKDLRVRNNRDHHILIYAAVKGHEITFSLFGQATGEKVELETKILKVYMPPVRYESTPKLPAGKEELTEGDPGFLVETWKTVYRGNEMVSKTKISTDSYSPYATVIRRGSGDTD